MILLSRMVISNYGLQAMPGERITCIMYCATLHPRGNFVHRRSGLYQDYGMTCDTFDLSKMVSQAERNF